MKYLFLLLVLVACNPKDYYKTFQVNYIENSEKKHLFLIVQESVPNQFDVVSIEYNEEVPNFYITEIFEI